MAVKGNLIYFQLQSPLTPHKHIPILHGRSIQMLEFRSRRRGRLKRSTFSVSSQLSSSSSPFENLFQNLLVQFPSINSLDLLVPALGFVSGVAFYLSNSNSNSSSNDNHNFPVRDSDSGDWILFTSRTPFNRFVTLRCPSIVFLGSELLKDVNEKLMKEESHFVRLNGRGKQSDVDAIVTELEYRRVCVSAEDGGVISLDWPANLELTEEHGFDTTILLVPGTVQGSMDENIRAFVCECLKSGCFPVVMNPRGCAGSPVTTPRVFSAADSDDVSTTIQFINRARPWTTLMSVGWGYGANMLTKYLAEAGEKTPLTAATCIDNPFDLQEAAAYSTYHVVDHELTGGLIYILQANKELFQGRANGFDVEKALAATSVGDFEKSITMVSHGFESIEDFYRNSSTRDVVDNVKIPLLFIQNDDRAVPLLSIPRSLIAENPFTSLLMCSSPPKAIDRNGRSVPSWHQHLIIEWLSAVELGLLKGRHPLIEDVDVAVDAKKGLQLMKGRSSKTSSRVSKILKLHNLGAFRGNMQYPSTNEMLEESDTTSVMLSSSGQDAQRKLAVNHKVLQLNTNGVEKQASPVDPQVLNDKEVDLAENEKGQVLQTTQLVMNMLDVAMPETLSDEQKKKVLAAVGQGETVMKALQDVVPEDVREKLTGAVSEILRAQRSNLKFKGFGSISQISDATLGLNTKIREKLGISTPGGAEDPSDEKKGVSGLPDHSNENSRTEDPSAPVVSEGDLSVTGEKSSNESGSRSGSADPSGEKSSEYHAPNSGANSELSSQSENGGESEDVLTGQNQVGEKDGVAHSALKEADTAQQTNENDADSSIDEGSMSSTTTEDSLSPSSSSLENQSIDTGSEHQVSEEATEHTVPNQNGSPAFGVSQAFDALTGIDDSTQMAVNSVFGVIENMITQLEETRDDETEMKVEIKSKVQTNGPESEDAHVVKKENKEDGKDAVEVQSYKPNDLKLYSGSRKVESLGNHISCDIKVPADNGDNAKLLDNNSGNIQQCMTKFPHGDPLYNEFLPNYLGSTMKDKDSLDLDTTSALFLDYIPEEGKWKLLDEQTGDGNDYSDKVTVHENVDVEFQTDLALEPECIDNINEPIEPAYVILDTEMEHEPVREYGMKRKIEDIFESGDDALEKIMLLMKKNVRDSLKVEISRRIQATEMEEMEPYLSKELEHIVNAISVAIVNGKEHIMMMEGEGYSSVKASSLHGEHVIGALSLALQETRYIRKVLPVGVIVGSSLAALRKFSNGAAEDVSIQTKANPVSTAPERYYFEADEMENDQTHSAGADQNNTLLHSPERYEDENESTSKNSDTVMVGAVTAALGASALFNQQQDPNRGSEAAGPPSKLFGQKENRREPEQLVESEKSEHNIVASLAEKAMSVAGPIVPTKQDGEVDQDRLVAMLADLGQKGGFLRLIGKIALLWGGIRGAMSLTDKLISFLRIAERSLLQRILAFACMVLVLWTPVVVPFLPTIFVQNWATPNSFKIAELTCIIGLYSSIIILVMLWGKRIRGYEDPPVQYGLELTSLRQVKNFFFGLIGGVMLVLFIHSLNASLGCVSLSWPTSSSYGKVFTYFGRGLLAATALAVVEELLFRAWLPDEIAIDLGYHRGVILSGLMFSLSQRSIWTVPGLWLLSLGLAGIRQRSQGNLSLPIGLRAGIMASSSVLQMGGFLTYHQLRNFPSWVSGAHLFQPFSGVVGLTVTLFWAILLYPRQPLQSNKIARRLKESVE